MINAYKKWLRLAYQKGMLDSFGSEGLNSYDYNPLPSSFFTFPELVVK